MNYYIRIFKKVLFFALFIAIAVAGSGQVNLLRTSGVKIYASKSVSGGSLPLLNDGNTSGSDVWWNSSSIPDTLAIVFKLPAKQVAVSYQMYFWGGAAANGSKVLEVAASQDSVNWTLLKKGTANVDPVKDGFVNTTAYQFYRFIFRGTIGSYVDLYEIELYDNSISAPVLSGSAASVGKQINLSWTSKLANNPFNSFELQRSLDGTNFLPLAKLTPDITSYQDSTLVQNTTYWYRMRARADTAFSPLSNTVKITTVSDSLKTAPVLAAVSRTGNVVPLTWAATINTPGSFEVYRSTDSINYVLRTTVDKTIKTYADNIDDTTLAYFYKVRSVNYTSSSPYSNVIKVTDTLKGVLTLTATAGAVGTKVNLAWAFPFNNTAGKYYLERSLNGTDFTALNTVDKTVTSYIDSTTFNATTYWYRVKAGNYLGTTPYSTAMKVTTVNDSLKNAPVLTASSATGTQAQLSWAYAFTAAVPAGFELEMSTDSITFTLMGKLDKSILSYGVESLKPNTTYWFRIRGYNYNSKSLYSNVPKITTNGIVGGVVDITDDGGKLFVNAENSGGANASEGSSKLIDNNTATKFLVFTAQLSGTLNCIYKPVNSYIVTGYALYSAGDAPGRDPRDWTFAGSNDSTTWTTLDTRTGQMNGARNTKYPYTIASPGTAAYKYYRISITANNGATDGVRFQIAEWEIYGISPNTPNLPDSLKATNATTSTIALSWNEDNAKPLNKFTLQRSTDGLFFTTLVDSIAANARTYTDMGLLDSAWYYYRIKAVGATSTAATGWSNIASAITKSTPGVPLTPGTLFIAAIADTTLRLQWVDRSLNETGFFIERSRDSVNFTVIDSVKANSTTYTDMHVWPANKYYYRIRSYISATIKSAYSNIAFATTSGANAAPALTLPVISRNICAGAGSYNFSFAGITAGATYEADQVVKVINVSSPDSTFFAAFSFDSLVRNGVVIYGFTTSGKAKAGDSTIINVTVKDNGGTINFGVDTLTIPVKFFFVPFSVTITADKPVTNIPRYGLVTLKARTSETDYASFVWTPLDNIEGSSKLNIAYVRPMKTTTYTVTAVTRQGCQASASITLSPQDSVVITNVLTPNGDGKNDKWMIWGLEKLTNVSVKVFNRNGFPVYSSQHYANDWDGTANGKLLEDGGYYYLVEYEVDNGSVVTKKQLKGILNIVRDRK